MDPIKDAIAEQVAQRAHTLKQGGLGILGTVSSLWASVEATTAVVQLLTACVGLFIGCVTAYRLFFPKKKKPEKTRRG